MDCCSGRATPLGDDFAVMAQNQVRNLHEARIVLLQIVAQRPA
jgi:hypothetical protein